MATNSFIFRNLNSDTDGLTVLAMPPKVIPEQAGKFLTVGGRDGYVFIDDGVSKPITMDITFIFKETEPLMAKLRENLQGEGELTLSTESGGFYKARVLGEVSFGYWLDHRACTVKFIAQPYLYLTSGKTSVTLTNGMVINNPGNVNAYPLFIISGSGTITITVGGSRSFSMYIPGTPKTVRVNSELMEAYTTTDSMNNNMTGEFPYLHVGDNTISWSGGSVTQIKIYPNTRQR